MNAETQSQPVLKIRLEGAPEDVAALASWLGNRLTVEQESRVGRSANLRNYSNRDSRMVRRYLAIMSRPMVCRVCGCDEESPCIYGCYWVEDDLCSNCEETEKLPAPEVLQDMLLLVGESVTLEMIQSWTPDQQQEAERWAGSVFLAASDNDVDVPERPVFLEEKCHDHG